MSKELFPPALCAKCKKIWSECKGTCSMTREELLIEQLKVVVRHYCEGMIDHETAIQKTWDAVWCGDNFLVK